MARMYRRRTRAGILLLAALLLTGCAGDRNAETETDAAAPTESMTETDAQEAAWQYPDVNYGGGEFRILNLDQLWDMFIRIDVDELNGEALNDAVYNRNRTVEDKLNCKIVEKCLENDAGNTITRVTDLAKQTIMANEDAYDVMYLPINQNTSLITEGYLLDLQAIPELHLDETWWDQDIIGTTTLDGKLYFVSGAANLMAFDSMWCLFFDENMMADQGLAEPYDLVREGKWTIDKLAEYCAAVANLNGDEKFTWKKDGKAVWGISAHINAPEKFYFSANNRTTTVEPDGSIRFTLGTDRFYSTIDKLAVLLSGKTGMTLKASTTDFDPDAGGYVYVFTTRRSLFMTAELKASLLMRDMEDNFGIVPFPKYDEAQENYQTNLVFQLFYMTIPTTNTQVSQTATIAEVLTHDSYEKVIPVYYQNVVEHKGLRNENSIEMLEIMRANRGVDLGMIFNWVGSLREDIANKLFNGDNQVASIVEKNKPKIESNIAEFVEFLHK